MILLAGIVCTFVENRWGDKEEPVKLQIPPPTEPESQLKRSLPRSIGKRQARERFERWLDEDQRK